jgi:hypothetical protein
MGKIEHYIMDDRRIEQLLYTYRKNYNYNAIKDLLIQHCGMDVSTLNMGVNCIYISEEYLCYLNSGLIRYHLLFSNDMEKIRYLLNKEFTYDADTFFMRLCYHRCDVRQYVMSKDTVESLIKRLPNDMQEHPYLQLLLNTNFYIKAVGCNILPIEHCVRKDNIVPDKRALAMIPRKKANSLEDKVNILLYNYRYTTISSCEYNLNGRIRVEKLKNIRVSLI